MSSSNRLSIAIKALLQLGFSQTALYAVYRLGLLSGHYKRVTPSKAGQRQTPFRIDSQEKTPPSFRFQPLFDLPTPDDLLNILGEDGRDSLLSQADEIAAGQVRLFGAEPVPLQLSFDQPLQHWTAYEKDASLYTCLFSGLPDVKFLWEPARFGWAFTLGRAWHISHDERYASAFWIFTERFLDANPTNQGPHWVSAQEVSLRLMAFVLSLQVFATSTHSTSVRQDRLVYALAEHATRIPVSLVYARSQNNNHLLSESAALFTAGLALPAHPQSERWIKLGWKWFNRGLQRQVDAYGEYSQHSSNYQRLMLQLALWLKPLAYQHGYHFSRGSIEALSIATHWLFSLLDPSSGKVPNLGANDGAYILPLTICPFEDYRPVLQAALRSFMEYQLPGGAWDEMPLWFGLPSSDKYFLETRYLGDSLYGRNSWGYLRAYKYKNRPSHADQLHFDLWWHGLNIARDAGTYLYNVDAPWDNALTRTSVHNTISVDGLDQMNRVSRFLYLDWAPAGIKHPIQTNMSIVQTALAWHAGYRHLGVRHERSVTVFSDEHWEVQDALLFIKSGQPPRTFRLHWLLPDWDWQLVEKGNGFELQLLSPHGWLKILMSTDQPGAEISLVRAGEVVEGMARVSLIEGWVSPTYGQKIPALSCALSATSQNNVKFSTHFIFPNL
ncbi:MAG: alginate lyase family protein [Chloroflexota bacterium]